MAFHSCVPSSEIARFVDLFWMSDGYTTPHERERILPDGTTQLLLHLKDEPLRHYVSAGSSRLERFSGPVIAGAYSTPFEIDTAQQCSMVGVHFKPGGLFPFLGQPVSELHNLHVPLEEVWGPEVDSMRNRLYKAITPAAKFAALEAFLLSRLTRPRGGHPAVAFALREIQSSSPPPTISELVDKIGLSQRRFIELFRSQVGMTPKLFCRLQRFNEALRALGASRERPWEEAARDYYDQAHFIHEFRELAGMTPSRYLLQRGEFLSHLPV